MPTDKWTKASLPMASGTTRPKPNSASRAVTQKKPTAPKTSAPSAPSATAATAATQDRSGEILIGTPESLTGAYQAAYGATGGMFGAAPVYGGTVLPTRFTQAQFTPAKATLLDPNQVTGFFNQYPVRPQELIGGNVEDQLRQQALARKAALEAKLAQLDSGYDMASEQIKGGYRSVADLLAQAQGNYTSGMGSVTAGQAQGNAGIQQSGMQQADAVARILASQGVTGVGADQAGAAASTAQAGANAVGITAAGALSGGQSTVNSFFSGLPALAAMGEAGGLGQAELMRTLTKGRATSESADAGLSAEQAIRDADLNYRRSVASQDVQASRARDDQVLQTLLSVIQGNNQTANSFAQSNASGLNQTSQFNASGLSSADAATVGDKNAASANLANARTQAEWNSIKSRQDFAAKMVEIQAEQAAAQAKAEQAAAAAGNNPKELERLRVIAQAQKDVNSRVAGFVDKGAARFFVSAENNAMGLKNPILAKDGSIEANNFSAWMAETQMGPDDVLVYLAWKAKGGAGTPSDPKAVSQAEQAIAAMAVVMAQQQLGGIVDPKGNAAVSSAQQDALAKTLRSAMSEQFNIMVGRGPKASYIDPAGNMQEYGASALSIIDQAGLAQMGQGIYGNTPQSTNTSLAGVAAPTAAPSGSAGLSVPGLGATNWIAKVVPKIADPLVNGSGLKKKVAKAKAKAPAKKKP